VKEIEKLLKKFLDIIAAIFLIVMFLIVGVISYFILFPIDHKTLVDYIDHLK